MRDKLVNKLDHASPMKIIPIGFITIILIGAFLLWLPVSSKQGGQVPFSDCFFTASSATCVTGLIRADTYTRWTVFGQAVILALIQIGGVGFMTLAMSFLFALRKKISIHSRLLMQNSIAAPAIGGMVKITGLIVRGTILFEGTGALLLSFYFIPRLGFLKGLWFGVFHSISAFCNAGFDLFGICDPNGSLGTVEGNWYINLIIMALITIGGLGFLVWKDLLQEKFHFSKLRLHSKIVIVTSAILAFGGAALIFIMEAGNPDFERMDLSQKILGSLFQSVTARTAGFNTMNLARMSSAAQVVIIILMFCGGSAGSTAGGMKTTTVAIQFLSIRTVFKKRKNVEAFHRTISDSNVQAATCVASLYLVLAILVAMIISVIEGIPFQKTLFESTSAICTVGSTLGITQSIGMVSKLLLAGLMIFGRSGSITILLAFATRDKNAASRYPQEEVSVG